MKKKKELLPIRSSAVACKQEHEYTQPFYGPIENGIQPVLGWLCRKCGNAAIFREFKPNFGL